MDVEKIRASFAEEKGKIEEAAQIVRDAEKKLDKLIDDKKEFKLQLQRLEELDNQDAIQRMLDGDESSPEKPKRKTRIRNLEENIAAIELAIPIQRRRLNEARERKQSAQAEAGKSVLPILLEGRQQSLQKCKAPLEDILQGLFELAAIDVLQERLVGEHGAFQISSAIDESWLFSGRKILENFEKALPHRIKKLACDVLDNTDEQVNVKAGKLLIEIGA